MTTRTKLASTLLACSLLTSLGCKEKEGGGGEVDVIRRAIPQAGEVEIKLPSGGSASQVNPTDGIGSQELAILGETAEMYLLTRGISVSLNGGAAFVLILARTIVAFPVTSMEGATYVWGPWTDSLNPSEWRMTVTPTADGKFDWKLEGRRKADGGAAAYRAVVAGLADPGLIPGRGAGSFAMDFEVAEALDPGGNNGEGQLAVTYDFTGDERSIGIDAENGLETVSYSYAERVDGTGDFQFTVNGDSDDEGAEAELIEIRSRWVANGQGRSDFRMSSGDLADVVVTGSECWDSSFSRTYYADSYPIAPTEGDVASCAFADALLPE